MKININVLKEWTENTIDINLLLDNLTLIGFESCIEGDNLNVLIPHNRLNSSNLFSILCEFNKLNNFSNKKIYLEKNSYKNNFEIKISEKQFCPLYSGIVISNINNKADLPLHIKNMLCDNGINLNTPVVDILNYVTLIFGQPLHAYDLNKINKKINVTKTSQIKSVLLLNNNEITLDTNTFVIHDSHNIIAIPGIIGSHCSKIDGDTTSIFLESAYFNPKHIADLSKKLNIKTCASDLFENFINPDLTKTALIYTTNLILNILDASCSNIIEKNNTKHFPKEITINLSKKSVPAFLGCNLELSLLEQFLLKLKFKITNFKKHWKIKIPAHRTDIIAEENIVAEIIKLYGFNNILEKPITTITHCNLNNHAELGYLKKITNLLVERGFFEIINYSFVDSDIEKILHVDDNFVYLKNPLSKNFDVMRSNLVQGLLKTAVLNLNKTNNKVNLFEKGNRFFYEDKKIITRYSLSAICSECEIFLNQKNYTHITFFVLKKLIEEIFLIINSKIKLTFKKDTINYLNKNITASIFADDKKIGVLGLLDGKILDVFSIKKQLYFFYIDLEIKDELEQKYFKKISKYPHVQRDLSLICCNTIIYEEIVTYIYNLKIKILHNIELLSLFSFEKDNTKSIALRLTFQSFDETLIDDNINLILDNIQTNLKSKFGVIIRTAS